MPFTSLFATVLLSVTAPAEFDLTCFYASRAEESGLERAEHCARQDPDRLVIASAVMADLAFDEHGLAPLATANAWRWVNRAGHSVPVLTYDNGADDFVEGLTRGPDAQGNIVFYDRNLDPVIRTPYRWAEPFEQGVTLVCADCVPERVAGGEHMTMVGKQWAAIGRDGRLVTPWLASRGAAEEALGARRR